MEDSISGINNPHHTASNGLTPLRCCEAHNDQGHDIAELCRLWREQHCHHLDRFINKTLARSLDGWMAGWLDGWMAR